MTSTLETASAAREKNERLTIGDVSASTKVPRSAIELLESGALCGLPAHVFVRGFIRSYAKAVGINEAQPLGLFDRAVNAKSEAARVEVGEPRRRSEPRRRRPRRGRRRSPPRARPRGVRDHPRADRDDHALAAAAPSAAVGRGSQHGAADAGAAASVAVDGARRVVALSSEHAGLTPIVESRPMAVVLVDARDRAARGELRRGRSDRHAVRARHRAAVGAGARRAQEPAPLRGRPRRCARSASLHCASAPAPSC